MRNLRVLAGALLLLSTAACGGCDEDLIPVNDIDASGTLDAGFFDDAGVLDSGVEPDAGIEEGRVLTFDGTSPINLYYGAAQNLRFVLKTDSGAAVAGETISFTLSGTGGSLMATMAVTDANGGATVRFTAGTVDGNATVTANAERATPATVSIVVREDPNANLTLRVQSNTRIPLTNAEALIYVGAAGSVPTCATLAQAAMPPTASLMASFTALPGTRSFSGLSSGSSVTVLALGQAANGVTIARACSEGTRLAGGGNTQITVTLAQDPTNLEGDYDVLLEFDMGQALPDPYDTTVGLIADIFSDPAGWAVYQTMARSDAQFPTTFVTWTPPGGGPARIATFREVQSNPGIFNTWNLASGLLDNFLANQLGQTYVDVTNVGADLSRIVREFEIGAEYAVTKVPNRTDRIQIVESWQAIVFTWSLNCPQGDLGCARRPIELSGASANLAPLQATYSASVAHSPSTNPVETERFQVIPDEHDIVMRYGAVILIALNEVVFPNLPGNIAGNSLTAVIGNIVQCTDVANSVAQATGLSAVLVEGLCNAGVSAAAAYVENRILQLDSQNNPGLIGRPGQGLTGGGELFLVDADHDVSTELLQNLTMYAQWTDPNDPNASQDLTAPIIGSGRKAATDCGTDADCTAGLVCTPIPSYLFVADIERDCRRPIGSTAGAVGCAANGDCASGLCYDPGTGISICYAACDGPGSCALGTCTQDAALIDLNPVLTGLGSVSTEACVP